MCIIAEMCVYSAMCTHNNQIKKETVCYTPACEWPAAIFSQACVTQTAPIITGVMFLFEYRDKFKLHKIY